jgi:signal transduction histidine kinase
MNRLRTRFILAFITVIFLMGCLTLSVSIAADTLGLVPENQQMDALLAQVQPGVWAEFQEISRREAPRRLATFLLIGAGVVTVAGILLSRSLTRPLDELADAARDIGAQNLSRRVKVKGTDEISDVARAFNEMATRLEQAETLRRNLLADVAHELRTPVTVLQGNLRAILDDVYPLDKEEVARLYEHTLHLTRLIDDLRELAQAEARQLPLNLSGVDVARLVKDTAVAFHPICESEGLTLRAELLGSLPTIHADRARLRQSLNNLLDNAIRHSTASSTIVMQAEQLPDELQLRVIDSGEGIAAEHLGHIFDRFYRVDATRSRETGGTGLGLAIVKAIAEAHGGWVTVTSAGQDQGSQFTIHLPMDKSG